MRSGKLQNEKNLLEWISQNDVLRNQNITELKKMQEKVKHLSGYPLIIEEKRSKIANPYIVLQKLYEFWYDDKITISNIKNRITVAMLFLLGLRESEFIKLTTQDFSFSTKTVSVTTLKQKNLKNKKINVPLNHIPDSELLLWEKCITAINNLFNVNRRTIYSRVSKFFGTKINPHALRHSLGLYLYEVSKDIRLVQEILRHTNIANTSIYTQIVKEELRKKLEQVK